MVIELSIEQFGLKLYKWFENQTSTQHKYDFRPKLHSTQFSYHFITPILKSCSFLSILIFI